MPELARHSLSSKAEKHDLGSQAGGKNKPKKSKSYRETYMLARKKLGSIKALFEGASDRSPITRARRNLDKNDQVAFEHRKREAKLKSLAKQHTTHFEDGGKY